MESVNPYALQGVALTPSDTLVFSPPLTGIYIGASTTNSTNIAVTHPNGNVVTYLNVVQGTILPVCASKVMATGTSASNLIGMRG